MFLRCQLLGFAYRLSRACTGTLVHICKYVADEAVASVAQVQLCRQVSSVFTHLHQCRLVHTTLRPGGILVLSDATSSCTTRTREVPAQVLLHHLCDIQQVNQPATGNNSRNTDRTRNKTHMITQCDDEKCVCRDSPIDWQKLYLEKDRDLQKERDLATEQEN
jgi:hypothetical protein